MKKIIITVSVIIIFLTCYCSWEFWYVNRFAKEMNDKLSRAVTATSTQEIDQISTDIEDYLQKRKLLFREVMSQDDMEEIMKVLTDINSYIREEQLPEARVAAAQMNHLVSQITGVYLSA